MARAVLVLTAVAAVAAVLAIDTGSPPGSGTFPVEVAGPEGTMFAGNVSLDRATAYTALLAAAAAGGFDVGARGSGEQLFVERIGPHANSGDGGWCYAVWEDAWVRPAHSAAVAGLADGQAVRWEYEAAGCGVLG